MLETEAPEEEEKIHSLGRQKNQKGISSHGSDRNIRMCKSVVFVTRSGPYRVHRSSSQMSL